MTFSSTNRIFVTSQQAQDDGARASRSSKIVETANFFFEKEQSLWETP